ncbi:isoprene synthase, chloroplastic isoform X2 [Vigna radiata var. radiata]|uniref:Isoprene synthase, chloroplastic isoform X2 n=1 Tax=Vigna radiata var. radiata TaxID=3916 RepID=A0A3Q0EW95_VIGRR|nr:isoprene synthase, chloroplastic isoform X2 [Vigna radiata var. radiata]
MESNVWGLPCSLSSTQAPSISSTKLLRDANKHHTPFRTPPTFNPTSFTHQFIHSLPNNLSRETLQERAAELEEKVRLMMNGTDMKPLSLLELIDDIERLGLFFRFQDWINKALLRLVSIENFKHRTTKSLHETALVFRILRRHGFHVSQDIFMSFKDEEGKFKAEISNDVEGMLSLYEASYLTLEGESLWEANEFSRTHLMSLMEERSMDAKMAEKVRHVLEGLPYHKSCCRLVAQHYINTYDKAEPHNLLLLELAKVEFNMEQSSYQNELKELSRWWWDIGLSGKLKFGRDRLVEIFIWAVAIYPEPQYAICRKVMSKIGILITFLDDIYDIYGTLDELELFTNVFESWNVNFINTLPDYMVLCFLAIYNTVNGLAYDIFKERGINCLPYLTKSWSDLCKAYLQEAKWFHNKIIPPFDKFIENAWISSTAGFILTHTYFLITEDITEQVIHSLTNNDHDLLRSVYTIFRLSNDLGTSKDEIERGETSNSIVSYMHETGLTEENARQYFKTLMEKEWKNLNKYLIMDSIFPKSFVQVVINLVRSGHFIYQHGDGFGRQNTITKNIIMSVLMYPFQLMCHDDVEK